MGFPIRTPQRCESHGRQINDPGVSYRWYEQFLIERGLSVTPTIRNETANLSCLYRAFTTFAPIEEQPVENHKPHLRDILTKAVLTSAIHDDELTVAQIAARHDCSPQTIYTYLKNHDIERPAKAPRTRRHPSLTIENVTVLYASGLSQSELAKHFNVSKCASPC